MGAAVQIFTTSSPLATIVYTDQAGRFLLHDLAPGTYQLKISAATFLPTLRSNLALRNGAHQVINVTLNTLFEAMQLLPARKQSPQDEEDWKWTLRAAGNRPILRIMDDGAVVVARSEEPKDGALKANVAFMAAGGDDGPFARSGEMTAFTVEHSLFSSGTVSVKGNVGYSGNGNMPWSVVRAAYSHQAPDGSRPEMALTIRNFASPSPALHDANLQALALSVGNTSTLFDTLEFNYGGEFQSVNFMGHATAFRPFGSLHLHFGPDTLIEYRYATSRPSTRLSRNFNSAPADLTDSEPRVTLVNSLAQLERAKHQEVSFSRRLDDSTTVEIAGFVDNVSNLALTGAGDFFGDVGDIVPDVYASTFSYNAGTLDTNGVRFVMQRKLLPDLVTATFDYSFGGALDIGNSSDWFDARPLLRQIRRQSLAWKFEGQAPVTHTRWQASYQWMNGRALTPVDMFNASPGQTDPYLNIFVRQPLPCLQGRIEALVDIRNLLAQGYIPVIARDGHTMYLLQSARSVRGGVAFSF